MIEQYFVNGLEYRLYRASVKGQEGVLLVQGQVDEDGDWFDRKEGFYLTRDEALKDVPGICEQATLGL